jgi:Ca2+-binding EF-hand superfamily protein
MMKTLFAMAALVLGLSANAGEQRPFGKLDVDGDGKLSKEEFLRTIKSENQERMSTVFDIRDKDDDGYLTLDEYTTPKKTEKTKAKDAA